MNDQKHNVGEEPDWRVLCFKFIGRSRRLDFLQRSKPKVPQLIIDKEKELIQKVYQEMRDACLNDLLFRTVWDHDKNT